MPLSFLRTLLRMLLQCFPIVTLMDTAQVTVHPGSFVREGGGGGGVCDLAT